MAHTDYGEIFCQAVSQIVKGEMTNLKFDVSKECTVMKIKNKVNGKYIVSDGSMEFEAQAGAGDYYEVGDQVIVTIPQGDYNKTISILNKIVNEWGGPAGFVRPMDTIIKCTDNVALHIDPKSLIANKSNNVASNIDQKSSQIEVLHLTNKRFYGFSRVAVQAEFKTLLRNLNVINGDYGLIFHLIQKDLAKNEIKDILTYKFSCDDMLGNPYEFTNYFLQDYAFDLPVNFTVHEVQVYFYQDGLFKDGNGTLIDAVDYNNLFVKNLEIYFGYKKDVSISEVVEISSDTLTYNNTGTNDRYIYLQWFHKLGENNLEQISAEDMTPQGAYYVRWYRHKLGVEDDTYGGANWEWINETAPDWVTNKATGEPYQDYPFIIKTSLNGSLTEEKFKVVALVKTHPLSNDPTYEVIERYTSNTLVFENTSEDTAGGSTDDQTVRDNLSLHFHDGSFGNYFIYDQNGMLFDSATDGPSKKRSVELMYFGEPVDKDCPIFKDIKSVEWAIPAQGNFSMIAYDTEQGDNTYSNPEDELLSSASNKWKIITKKFSDKDDEWSSPVAAPNATSGKGFYMPVVDEDGNFRDAFIYQEFKYSNNGAFSLSGDIFPFTSSTSKVLSKLNVNLELAIWTSKDGTNWHVTGAKPITLTVSCESGKKKSINRQVFRLNREHQYMRVGVRFIKQSQDKWPSYKKNSTDEDYTAFTADELKEVNWNVEIDNFSFKLQSNLYTNTSYPTEDKLNTAFEYSILSTWTQERNNNTIKCTVTMNDGQRHILTETMRFGTKGTMGTSNTFILEMLDGKNALVYDDANDNTLRVEAVLISNTGRKIYFTEEQKAKVKWSLINEPISIDASSYNESSTEKIVLLAKDADDEDPTVTLTYKKPTNETVKLKEYYVILAAELAWDEEDEASKTKPILKAYLPIPIRSSKCYAMSGANQILYNHMGVPKYGNNPYIAYTDNDDGDPVEHLTWHLTQIKKKINGIWKVFNPNPVGLAVVSEGEDADLGSHLVPSPLYASREGVSVDAQPIQDKICVYCTEGSGANEKILWSQPIMVMQSNYDFAMLNSWDGKFMMDEENGIILATMLGAGKKNSQNQFSGVLMGDVQGGTKLNSTEAKTGVYGFENGIMTYGLREDGSGFFGAQHGRIIFDGKSGTIHSAGWYQDNLDGYKWKLNRDKQNISDPIDGLAVPMKSTGTFLDLDDGKFLINGGEDSYIYFNEEGKGELKMALSGANITLTDKNNKNLSGYIDVTAQGLTTEFRRTASYYAICETEDSLDSENSNNQYKILDLKNFSTGFQSAETGIDGLTIEDVLKNGVTIAVTFTKAETLKTETIDKIENEIVVGKTQRRKGRVLYLKIKDSDKSHRIKVNGIFVNARWSDDSTGTPNPYGWAAGSTIYFTFVKESNSSEGYWEVVDSGSYSKITQTADEIRSEVSTIGGNLSSSITQTAEKIELNVAQKANYNCICKTAKGTAKKWIRLTEADYANLSNVAAKGALTAGLTISVTFENGNSVIQDETPVTFQLCDKNGNTALFDPIPLDTPSTIEPGETLSFTYTGSKFAMTSLSNSKITQTANAITSEISRKNGYACEGAKNTNHANRHYDLAIKATNPDGSYMAWSDLKRTGVVIAVTFTAANNDKGSIWLSEDGSSWHGVYTYDGKETTDKNPLCWSKGAVLYFTYDSSKTITTSDGTKYPGVWKVVDSGAYSKITQTADEINATVGKVDERVSELSIRADGIEASASAKANYSCTCSTAAGTNVKTISGGPTDGICNKGCVLAIKFTNKNELTKDVWFRLKDHDYYVTDGTTWKNGELLAFICYEETNDKGETVKVFKPTSVGESRLSVLSDEITAKVVTQEYGGDNFAWSLTKDGFYINGGEGVTEANSKNFVFSCDTTGITTKGRVSGIEGTFKGLSAGQGIYTTILSPTYLSLAASYTSSIIYEEIGKISSAEEFDEIKKDYTNIYRPYYNEAEKKWYYELIFEYPDHEFTAYKQAIGDNPVEYGGKIRLGAPDNDDLGVWNDITIYAVPLSNSNNNRRAYGNIGSPAHYWDTFFIRSITYISQRELKEDIKTYNINQAYDELKEMPLYTYYYKDGPDKKVTKTFKLGTMIDYIPMEVMNTKSYENNEYDFGNLAFWNIAATKALQEKLENALLRIEELENERKLQ